MVQRSKQGLLWWLMLCDAGPLSTHGLHGGRLLQRMQASQQPSAKDFSLMKEGASSLLMLKDLLLAPCDEHGGAPDVAALQCSAVPSQGHCCVHAQQLSAAGACGSSSVCRMAVHHMRGHAADKLLL